VVVVTDEQSHDGIYPGWAKHNYLINVGSYKPSLSTKLGWTQISGFSENIVRWIREVEQGE
jgi:hypothetical protein